MGEKRRVLPRNYQAGYRVCKRLLDILLSAAGLVLFSPLMLAIAAGVLLSGPGPILYRHRRMGKGGVPFVLYKFRTMVKGADAQLGQLPASLQQEFQRSYKLQNDPRATAFGAALRKSSLDELPQLFNVLRGEMSFVGPRPIVEAELDFYGRQSGELLAVRPGLSGYWQVNGRSASSYAQRMEMELFYVANVGFFLDCKILWLTIGAVLGRRGAV